MFGSCFPRLWNLRVLLRSTSKWWENEWGHWRVGCTEQVVKVIGVQRMSQHLRPSRFLTTLSTSGSSNYLAFLEMNEFVKCFSIIIAKLVASLKLAISLSFHKYIARGVPSKPLFLQLSILVLCCVDRMFVCGHNTPELSAMKIYRSSSLACMQQVHICVTIGNGWPTWL